MVSACEEEQPADDFEAAYNWFSSQYAEPGGDNSLLSERESRIFSQFLDTILTEKQPSSQQKVRFLDGELYKKFSNSSGANVPPPGFSINPAQAAQTEFYRGFVNNPGKVASFPRAEAFASTTPPSQSLKREANDDSDTSPKRQKRTTPPAHTDTKKDEEPRRRDVMSEDQIRRNHILSERRRRDSIKQLFKEMCSLVPGCDAVDRAVPKAAILERICQYIEESSKENQRLRSVLKEAGVATDTIPSYI